MSILTVLGSKEAEMRIIGCDLHASQQSIAMLDQETGETFETTLKHEGDTVRDFYAALPRPTIVGIEATGSMGWFLRLMEDLGITCHVGHPARIRATEPRRQKHDRRDAVLLRDLLADDRFPTIWQPSAEFRDLRALLLHRDEWVRMRTRVRNALQSVALAHGIRRRAGLWSREGLAALNALPLSPRASDRRAAFVALHGQLMQQIHALDEQVRAVAEVRPQARRLMTHPGVGPVTALATEVFLGDPTRFRDAKAVASYIGMIPSEYSSGPRQRLGRLTKQGNRFVRFLWCEAGLQAARREPSCGRFYRRKLQQKGVGKARVAVGRKLGIRLWILLRDQIDFAEFCRRAPSRSTAA
jgi:transposase